MFRKYQELKDSIVEIEKEVNMKQSLLSNSTENLYNLKLNKELDEQKREDKIQEEIDRFLNELLKAVEPEYDDYKKVLENYRKNSFKEINKYKAYINNFSFIDDREYIKDLKTVKEKSTVLKSKIDSKLSQELIGTYGKIFNIKNLTNKQINTMTEWIDYFEDYDSFDSVMSSIEMATRKTKSIEDKTILLFMVAVIVLLTYTLRIYLAIAIISYTFVVLYLRGREFYYLARLASVANYLANETESFELSRSETLSKYKDLLDNEIIINISSLKHTTDTILNNINIDKERKKEIIRESFNREEFREKAEAAVEITSDVIQQRIDEEQIRKDNLATELDELEKRLKDKKQEVVELKDKIKKTYEELEPSFSEYQMINSFFLGFDEKDEPVTFNYTGDPTLIIYNSEINNQKKALMDTIIMMCCQIMTAMSPLTYRLNVVDTFTGGSALSAFQVTSEKEESEESELFKTITTSNSVQELIKYLYSLYNERRVKILGTYTDIYEYNEDKKSKNARTESFIVNIMYEYDYSILASDEKLRQLCRIGKDVGILFIFVLDTAKIESPNRTKDNETTKVYPYKPDLISKIDMIKNVHSFKILDAVEIVDATFDTIRTMIKNNL